MLIWTLATSGLLALGVSDLNANSRRGFALFAGWIVVSLLLHLTFNPAIPD